MQKKTVLGALAAMLYIGVVVLANDLSTRYGLVSIGFGLSASAGTYAAGAALGLRDLVQDGLGKFATLGVIAVASIISYLIADPFIATASLAAFATAELCDFAVYTPLRSRGFTRAVLVSNVIGAAVDTVVFLWIAPFPLTAVAYGGQMVGKVVWMTLVPLLLFSTVRACVALRRDPAVLTA